MDDVADDLAYWLALSKAPGVGPVAFQKLTQKISPRAFFHTDHTLWQAINFSEATRAWLARPDWRLVEQDLAWAEQPDCHILRLTDEKYPALLKAIHDPPPVLYVKGNLGCLQSAQLAMVGSRNASPWGGRRPTPLPGNWPSRVSPSPVVWRWESMGPVITGHWRSGG